MNMLLAAYFAFIGAFALAATVDPVIVELFGIKVGVCSRSYSNNDIAQWCREAHALPPKGVLDCFGVVCRVIVNVFFHYNRFSPKRDRL